MGEKHIARSKQQIAKKYFAPVLLFVFCYLFAFSVHAQSPGFTLSPVKTFLQLTRGTQRQGVFEVVNRSNEALPLEVQANFFGVQDELGTIAFHGAQSIAAQDNPDTWLKLKQPFLLFGPQEARLVPYAIAVPEDAPFGTYSIAALFRSKFPQQKTSSPSAQLLPAIGSLFFVDVVPRAGEELSQKGKIKIENFGISPTDIVEFRPFGATIVHALRLDRLRFSFVEKSPLTFVARVKNENRYMVRPTGTVEVRGGLGGHVGRALLPDGAILPGATRQYALTFEKPSQSGVFSFLPDMAKKNFLPGRYTAHLALASNSSYAISPEPYVFTFWAFPRAFMLSTGLPLTVLIFMLFYKRRILSALKIFLWQKS